MPESKIAVVIPSYKVSAHILQVLEKIGQDVAKIYVVDDACPEASGKRVEKTCSDPRVKVLFHPYNQGVGAATLTGLKFAIKEGASIIVKIDGDGQMDPALIPQFVYPLIHGLADYTKGNRFYSLSSMGDIPFVRKFGNLFLSFFTKLSSGYYHIFDPTNGYFAIHAAVANLLEHEKISQRYFFESDLLFRLNVLDAVVLDIPMKAHYGDEKSSLVIHKIVHEFLFKNLRNFLKRIFYNYFLRDFNPASLALILGLSLSSFGFVFGVFHWLQSLETKTFASAGTVMVAAITFLLGVGFLLSFMNYDLSRHAKVPLQRRLFF